MIVLSPFRVSSSEVAVSWRKWFDRLTLRSTSRTCRCLLRFRLSGPRLLLPALSTVADTSTDDVVTSAAFCGEAAAAGGIVLACNSSRKSSKSSGRQTDAFVRHVLFVLLPLHGLPFGLPHGSARCGRLSLMTIGAEHALPCRGYDYRPSSSVDRAVLVLCASQLAFAD